MTTKKYHCPHHEEKTPSAVAYANGYFSFCCGRSGPLSELGLKDETEVPRITYVEDLPSTISTIKSLPRKKIRGFPLHYNSRGYFLLWPSEDYYKLRIEGAEAGSKYRGPSGHKKPPFVISRSHSSNLALVEGEFNALSLGVVEPLCDIVSPGGAGDFYSSTGRSHFPEYAKYETVHVVTDSDAAGAQAAIETKAALVTLGCPDVRIHLVEKDFNDILVQDGKEALREEARRMGLLEP